MGRLRHETAPWYCGYGGNHRRSDGKAISNLFEKMDWKVERDINIPVGVQVEPVEGVATIYGEYRNQLSVKVADIKVIQPTAPVSGGKG